MKRIKALLFQNTSVKQTIFKNTFWITFAEIVTRLLKFILFVYVIRFYGALEFGIFSFAYSIVALIGIFFDFGLSNIITREFAKHKNEERVFPSIIALKLIMGILTVVLILIVSLLLSKDPLVIQNVGILAIYLFLSDLSATYYAFIRAKQKMEYEGWLKILSSVMLVVLGFLTFIFIPKSTGLSLAHLVSMLILWVCIISLFKKGQAKYEIDLEKDIIIWKKYLSYSWPLAITTVILTVCYYTDSVMLGYFGLIKDTGVYNAIYKVIGISAIAIPLITQGFYPLLSKNARENKTLEKSWGYQNQALMFLAIPITIGGWYLAGDIITLLFGVEYIQGVVALKILFISSFMLYVAVSCNQLLIVKNYQKEMFFPVSFGAVLNIILNYLLIPKYGLNGAAMATAISNMYLLVVGLILVRKFLNYNMISSEYLKTILCSMVAGVLMLFLIKTLKVSLIINIAISGNIYIICFYVMNKYLMRRSIYEFEK
ncbi:MAG: hypothetical protein A2231_02365 [Candidatus Firestonebacteria bacterium RIFOXYA2_FULL_40_8]|nr:MAG: hypothetical protein A2231_02365 [Candidatus Firestonebacteria bacterium RIFOXYA2_FULL_40_8]